MLISISSPTVELSEVKKKDSLVNYTFAYIKPININLTISHNRYQSTNPSIKFGEADTLKPSSLHKS